MNTTTTTLSPHMERTRPLRVDALMWIAQHAGILADGYVISAGNTHDPHPDAPQWGIGCVQVQGEAGALSSLVARFDAVRSPERPNGFTEWIAYDEGVRVCFVEDPAK